jgi:hypothetical protein
MAIDEVDRTVVTESAVTDTPATESHVADPPVTETPVVQASAQPASTQHVVQTESHHSTTSGPGSSELIRRITVLAFGLVQIVIGARIILLLLNAREANGIVSGILNVSQFFVAPFNGILNTNALTSGGSTLDTAAILALVGWSVVELIVIWATGIFRHEPAYA